MNGRKRVGAIYIAVLGATLMVALLAISALTIQRIQRRSLTRNNDARQAARNARTGIRIGMLRIKSDPDWRFRVDEGRLGETVSTGDGSFSLLATDPTDGDLLDDPADPVILISSGRRGDAIQNVSVTLLPSARSLNCLEVGICAGDDVALTDVTLHYFGTISANDDISESGTSFILPNAEAADQISGADFAQETTENTTPRELPDPAEVFEYYLEQGTEIDINSLPLSTPNLTRHRDFESGIGDWTHSWESGLDCELEQVTGTAHGGTGAMRVFQRSAWNDGACYDLTFAVKESRLYRLEAWVKLDGGTNEFRFALNTRGSQSGDKWKIGPSWDVDGNWTKISADLTPAGWDGQLERAMIKIETTGGGSVPDFYVDDVSVVETGSFHRITRQVLGADLNPFGTGNPEGIYVIDCQNKPLLIEHSRIDATLVLTNLGGGSRVGVGPIHWGPATNGYPALLVDGDFRMDASRAGLNEHEDIMNYNPPLVPSADWGADDDQNDTFASRIGGIVYVNGKLTLTNEPVFAESAIVTADDLIATGAIKLTHAGRLVSNPPPGFSGPEVIRVLLGSYHKAIDVTP